MKDTFSLDLKPIPEGFLPGKILSFHIPYLGDNCFFQEKARMSGMQVLDLSISGGLGTDYLVYNLWLMVCAHYMYMHYMTGRIPLCSESTTKAYNLPTESLRLPKLLITDRLWSLIFFDRYV